MSGSLKAHLNRKKTGKLHSKHCTTGATSNKRTVHNTVIKMYSVTQYGWETTRRERRLHVKTRMLLLLSSHLSGINCSRPVFCLYSGKVNSAGDQSFLHTVRECWFQHVFPLKKNSTKPQFPQLILERWASPRQQTSAHLKLSCAIFIFFFKPKTFQSNWKADCNPESKSLRLVSFFPWLRQMQGMLLNT